MTAVELLPPGTGPHDERWHELRRAGVTASEIAVVMGLSPYDSPFNLYWAKTNDWRWGGNEYTGVGSHLEDAIADWWFAECDPLENAQPGFAGLYAHPDRPWQLATPDRLVYETCSGCDGEGFAGPEDVEYGVMVCRTCHGSGNTGRLLALVECKWVAYSWDGWGEQGTDEIPVHYRAQALWQLDVMGVDEVHFAALGPGGFRSYLVRRDEADLAVMRKAGEDFVRRLTEGDPPPLDSHTATLGALKRLHPEVGEGDVECTPDLAFEYATAREVRKDAEATIAACEALIRDRLGSTYRRLVCDGQPVASRSVYEHRSFELTRFRADHPDLAAEYTTTSTVDKLNPPRSKKS